MVRPSGRRLRPAQLLSELPGPPARLLPDEWRDAAAGRVSDCWNLFLSGQRGALSLPRPRERRNAVCRDDPGAGDRPPAARWAARALRLDFGHVRSFQVLAGVCVPASPDSSPLKYSRVQPDIERVFALVCGPLGRLVITPAGSRGADALPNERN